ncbi:rho-6 family protein [Megaselia abdita]
METTEKGLKAQENIESDSRNKVNQVPWMILTITLLQCVFYLFPFDKIFIYDPTKKLECWRFITYTVVHSTHMHLLVNVLSQLVFALFLEREQGHLKILIILTTGAISGCLVSTAFHPYTLLRGSSAGAYSIIMGSFSPETIRHTHIGPYQCGFMSGNFSHSATSS